METQDFGSITSLMRAIRRVYKNNRRYQYTYTIEANYDDNRLEVIVETVNQHYSTAITANVSVTVYNRRTYIRWREDRKGPKGVVTAYVEGYVDPFDPFAIARVILELRRVRKLRGLSEGQNVVASLLPVVGRNNVTVHINGDGLPTYAQAQAALDKVFGST